MAGERKRKTMQEGSRVICAATAMVAAALLFAATKAMTETRRRTSRICNRQKDKP